MIKVFLEDNDGHVTSIDYGLDAKSYKRVVKVEMLEETSKLKNSLNTIIIDENKSKKVPVGFSGTVSFKVSDEIKEPPTPAPKKKHSTHTNGYEIFNPRLHSTDEEYYWIECRCSNCFKISQIVIKKGKPCDQKKLKLTACPDCQLSKTLKRAKWKGREYVVITK